jgi:hypothetical protein
MEQYIIKFGPSFYSIDKEDEIRRHIEEEAEQNFIRETETYGDQITHISRKWTVKITIDDTIKTYRIKFKNNRLYYPNCSIQTQYRIKKMRV